MSDASLERMKEPRDAASHSNKDEDEDCVGIVFREYSPTSKSYKDTPITTRGENENKISKDETPFSSMANILRQTRTQIDERKNSPSKLSVSKKESPVEKRNGESQGILQRIRIHASNKERVDRSYPSITRGNSPEESPNSDIVLNEQIRGNDSPRDIISKAYSISSPGIPWTKEIEEEVMRFSQLCTEDENEMKKTEKNYSIINRVMQISVLLSGAASVYIASSTINDEAKKITTTVLGGITSVTTGVYSMISPAKKAAKASEASTRLRTLARKLRLQLLSSDSKRKEPFSLIIESEKEREKALQSMKPQN
jgi:hypothetical protein